MEVPRCSLCHNDNDNEMLLLAAMKRPVASPPPPSLTSCCPPSWPPSWWASALTSSAPPSPRQVIIITIWLCQYCQVPSRNPNVRLRLTWHGVFLQVLRILSWIATYQGQSLCLTLLNASLVKIQMSVWDWHDMRYSCKSYASCPELQLIRDSPCAWHHWMPV